MVPGDVTALLVVLVAVLPGSVYTWAVERHAAPYGVTFGDRVLRFLAVSVGFHLVLAWPSYLVYRAITPGRVSATDVAVAWVWSVVLVAVPAAAGSAVGSLYTTRTTRSGWRRGRLPPRAEDWLLRLTLGPRPAPRAWDHLFSTDAHCHMTVRTIDGEEFFGWYGGRSYAALFPQEPDLLLEEAWPAHAINDSYGSSRGYRRYIPAGRIGSIVVFPSLGSEKERR